MIIDRLRAWQPAPGRMWHLEPTRESVERVRSAPPAGAPSFLQRDHLSAYVAGRAQGRTHRAWTGTAGTVPHALDLRALERALARLVAAQESLRSWFDLAGPEPVCHAAPAGDLAFEAVPAPVEGPWPAALHAHMERTFDERCRPDRWAPYALGVIEHEGSFSLWWGCDHAFTDGASQLMVLDDLADLYRAEAGVQVDAAGLVDARPVGSVREHAQREHAAAAAAADGPEVERWCEIVAAHDGALPRSPIDLGLAPGESAPAVPTFLPLLDAEGLRALESRCRASGSSVQAAVYVALGVATVELIGEDELYAVTVLSTRDGDTARTFGWLCNFAPVVVPVGDRPAEELLASASAALEEARSLAAVPVHAALGAMLARGVTTPERLGSPQMVSYLDMRRFPAAGREPYESAVHFSGEGRTANTSLWVQREQGRLYVGVLHPDDPQVLARCRAFVTGMAQVLEQIARGQSRLAAGLAPARG